MSVTFDVNLLLFASDTSSEFHERAQKVLHEYAAGQEIVYLFWPVVMGYLRIATHPAIFDYPLSPDDALANAEGLIGRSNVRSPGEDEGFLRLFRETTSGLTVRGNLVPDAHLVALMRQYDVRTIVSNDRDFRKFDGIQVLDPFQ